MSPEAGLATSFLAFLVLITAGMTVPFAILIPGVLYLFLLGGWSAFNALGFISWANMNGFTLTAIPLFLFMAEILQSGGLTLRVYRGLSHFFSRVPGGLLQTNIAGCAVFAACSGSSVATAASIGSVALPELIKRGYNRPMAAGSLAAGGTLGILLPPSIALIIYSTFTETSVAKLFLAGLIPGLTLAGLFMGYIAAVAKFMPARLLDTNVARRHVENQASISSVSALADIVPLISIVVTILGSIYLGWATPTEAAAIGCSLAILLAGASGGLTYRMFAGTLHRTIVLSGNILFLVFSAYVYSHAISFGGVAESLTKDLIALKLTRIEFFVVLFVLYTVLGCLVESVGMIVITVPLLFPILPYYNIDPIWFGIVLVIFVELGMISPPIGINLFVIQSLWDGNLGEVVRGTIPFHVLMFVLLLLLLLFPALALWLPSIVHS